MNEATLGIIIAGAFVLAGQVVTSVWGPRLTAKITARGQIEAEAGTENTRLRRGIRMHIPICDDPTDLVALLKPPTS